MRFESRSYINGVEVRAGAAFVNPVSTQPILGRRVGVGALCEQLSPDRWRAVITAEGNTLWQSAEAFPSLEAADQSARDHYRQSIDRALIELFR